MVVGIFSKFIPDIVNKDIKISNVLSKQGFEVRPCDKSGVFLAMLVLILLETKGTTELSSDK